MRTLAWGAVAVATVFVGMSSAQERPTGQELPSHVIPNLGEAAEFYFSPDGTHLIGNAKRSGDTTHHVYTTSTDGRDIRRINGIGRDACSYYLADGKRLVWTSTRDLPSLAEGDYSNPKAYPQGAELYTSDLDGGQIVRLTNNTVYDAEVSASPDGAWLLFTRQLEGKLDLWRMKPDGTQAQQITHTDEWQEGGAFYMPDSRTIIYRAWKRENEGQRGMPMTLFTIKHDGTGTRELTHDSGTNWSPHPAPDGRHYAYVRFLPPQNFEVFLGDLVTGEITQLTFHDGFDGFPSFSPDGKWLAFASNRDTPPGARVLYTYLMDVSSLKLGPATPAR